MYATYFKGAALRKRSPFAQQLSDTRGEKQETGDTTETNRVTTAGNRRPSGARKGSIRSLGINGYMGSYRGTPKRTPVGSRTNSAATGTRGGASGIENITREEANRKGEKVV